MHRSKVSNVGPGENILERTLQAAKQDVETVKDGAPIAPMIDGLVFRDLVTHRDDRGSVTEFFDPRWDWHPDPLVFCYHFSIRPGLVKGWGLHKLHEDRYLVIDGEMEVVMFDPRPESSTCGHICRVVLSAATPRLMNVPKFVWHADHNIGEGTCRVVNFPTIQYNHENPDKYRLPLDTDLIPFDFGAATGW
ncbi:cupin domain-containing protein [Cucumibacter marinus]|uniref:cupin domain-containing protein n=1 Tax=Cucumibacter marinus TaxID=1121252 RepID=UPI0003F9BEC9|nr:dTDP-4-dehydrorhamnose 3,5-epimerase family protein [Cucumibacter marinus]